MHVCIYTHSKCRALIKHTLGPPLTVCKLAKKFSATKIPFFTRKNHNGRINADFLKIIWFI